LYAFDQVNKHVVVHMSQILCCVAEIYEITAVPIYI